MTAYVASIDLRKMAARSLKPCRWSHDTRIYLMQVCAKSRRSFSLKIVR